MKTSAYFFKRGIMSQVYILAVAGGSGSGKTYFAQALANRLGPQKAMLLSQDSYYIDQSDRFDHDGGSVNFDHPNSLDFDLMAKQITQVKNQKSIEIPIYDYATHKRKQLTVHQKAKPVIIVDGILVLGQPKLRELFTESIFVETPENIRYERRLQRDISERGRTPEGVRAQFKAQVKPMHDKFVEPSKEFATYINSGTDINEFNSLLEQISNNINDYLL